MSISKQIVVVRQYLTGNRCIGCSRAVVREHIDAYFDYIYPIPVYSFLHRADFLAQYASSLVPSMLLLAVCGIASRFLPADKGKPGQARAWIELSEKMVNQSLGQNTITAVQTLMIIALYHTHNHQTSKSSLYLALASRMAYLLKLHMEDSRVLFVEQECRRRLIWCMFTMDRFHAGGVPVSDQWSCFSPKRSITSFGVSQRPNRALSTQVSEL
jgi:hypothetical protein